MKKLLVALAIWALLATLSQADEYSENKEVDAQEELNWPEAALEDNNRGRTLPEEVYQKLHKMFGIKRLYENEKTTHHNQSPPQFMVELYNTISDPSGVIRGKNPYNAKVVRSFIERDNSLSHFYLFNISGLEANESVLEAELHLYRKKTPLKAVHPSILSSPYYLIRVYQVLPERSLDVPDLHRLLNVHYVGAYASGWQVFNVKQAVLAWVGGEPNLGLLVTTSTLFGDNLPNHSVEFSRRNNYHHSKQPILVLFDDDGKEEVVVASGATPVYDTYNSSEETESDGEEEAMLSEYDEVDPLQRSKRDEGQPELEQPFVQSGVPELFKREKIRGNSNRRNENEQIVATTNIRDRRSPLDRKRSNGIVAKRKKMIDVVGSMSIYERAQLREKMEKAGGKDSSASMPLLQIREKRATTRSKKNVTTTSECSRHDLYVDFKDIGLSTSIIAPKGYTAYHCTGQCNSPLSQDQQPTNHATVQSIVHKMGLAKGVEMPCCVPTKLLSTSILFYDDNENVVLKVYEDMIADRCGCR